MHARRKHPGYEPACGGALITAKVVLTAAHCVEIGPNETASKKLRVRLGEHDTSTTSESPHGHVDLVPDRVIAHEGYDASLVKNDIALVVLRGRAPLGKGIGTACLPSEDGGASRLNGKAALVAGWGATSSGRLRGSADAPRQRPEVLCDRSHLLRSPLRRLGLPGSVHQGQPLPEMDYF